MSRVSKYLFEFSCIRQQWEWAGTCYFFLPSKEFDLVEVEVVRLHCAMFAFNKMEMYAISQFYYAVLFQVENHLTQLFLENLFQFI